MERVDGRAPEELRSVSFEAGFQPHPEGSVLVRWGGNVLLCSVICEERVPPFLAGKGQGWITAEYDMLPGSGNRRIRRDRTSISIKGRSSEIQRLIGRSLRQCVDLSLLGERTLTVDCDVLVADGGTRVAAITGGSVALGLAVRSLLDSGRVEENPFVSLVAGVSMGLVDGEPLLDLCYEEDSRAAVDMNLVANEAGEIVELQASAERSTAPVEDLIGMMGMGLSAIVDVLVPLQRAALEP